MITGMRSVLLLLTVLAAPTACGGIVEPAAEESDPGPSCRHGIPDCGNLRIFNAPPGSGCFRIEAVAPTTIWLDFQPNGCDPSWPGVSLNAGECHVVPTDAAPVEHTSTLVYATGDACVTFVPIEDWDDGCKC